jgi:hypothetical protein
MGRINEEYIQRGKKLRGEVRYNLCSEGGERV